MGSIKAGPAVKQEYERICTMELLQKQEPGPFGAFFAPKEPGFAHFGDSFISFCSHATFIPALLQRVLIARLLSPFLRPLAPPHP